MLPSKFKKFLKLFFANILVFLAVAIIIEFGGQIYAYFHPAYKVIPFATLLLGTIGMPESLVPK